MIFALLYGLGLRVGEVTRLKLSDVDLVRSTLFIRDTKFGKSRIVPFGPESRKIFLFGKTIGCVN
jgi:integrase